MNSEGVGMRVMDMLALLTVPCLTTKLLLVNVLVILIADLF